MRTIAVLTLCTAALAGTGGNRFDEALLEPLRWREIGPANPGGRVTDIAVVESKPQHFLIAAATGGVWKTTNNATTWTPIFDKYGTASIGDIAVCQTNPDVIWVGTGEANPRNSVTPGDGIYKSTDGGKTFAHMGLRDTRHIGRILIDEKAPDTVLVAALGCVYKPSRERGIYKTTDGGKTWRCVKFVDEEVGFVDLVSDPNDPKVVYAGSFSAFRDAFSGSGSASKHLPAGGIFKSTDGGETWTKLAKGLPTTGVGRIGLDVWRKDPRVIVAVVETAQSAAADTTPTPDGPYIGITAEDQEQGVAIVNVVKGAPAEKAGFVVGDIMKEFGGQKVESRDELYRAIRTRKPGDKVKVKLDRAGEEVNIELTIGARPEETPAREIGFDSSLRDSLTTSSWEPPQDPANKGGVYKSEDGGETWTHLSTTNPRPWYYSQIRIDPADAQRIYVLGVSLHVSSDGGKTFNGAGARGIHVDHHAMWIDPRDGDRMLLGCDGGINATYDRGRTWEHLANLAIGQFYAVGVDMSNPYRVYGGLQDNGTWGGPSRTRNSAITNDDWSTIHGGDGFYAKVDPTDPNTVYCESQYGVAVRLDRKTGVRKSIRPRTPQGQQPPEELKGLRWEWNTPIELSPIDPRVVYLGASKVLESTDRGDTIKPISGDLCKTKQGAIAVIGPSPVDINVIWAGTNDGGVHVTRDRGKTWTDATANVPGLPPLLWVTRIEPSRASAGAAYLTAEGRRKDDFTTYVWKTEDFGRTWRRLTEGLPPAEPVYVIREDVKNPGLLFLGTERTVYVSIDGGRRWVSLQRNLPVVPVHDLAVHPRDGELVAATHGRSVWVMDVEPLRQMTDRTLEAKSFLFEPAPATRWLPGKTGFFGGAKGFRGQTPQGGAVVWYYLAEKSDDVSVSVLDAAGKPVTKLQASGKAGLNRATWNMMRGRERAAPGEYTVALSARGLTQTADLRVMADPTE